MFLSWLTKYINTRKLFSKWAFDYIDRILVAPSVMSASLSTV